MSFMGWGELGLPGLHNLVRDGSPIYAWSYADRPGCPSGRISGPR
jgi:hypothetical protein